MPRSDRLLRLLHVMRTMSGPITAARLAAETGVSVRSLYRDIDALRASGARIDGERGYGYRLLEDPALPPQNFDRDEIEVLALSLAEVRAWGDPALTKAADSVFAKLAATLSDERERQLFHAIAHVFRPEPRYAEPLDLASLRYCCRHEEAMRIRYRDIQDSPSERTIWPLALVYNETCVTILGWCELRQDFRMFRTDRLTGMRPTGVSFRPRRVPLLREYITRLHERRTAQAGEATSASGQLSE
jgi:predicted DNA-binding transcriptional regulator YafY